VKLIVTCLDRDYGFRLEACNIDQRLKERKHTTIQFTADKVGAFNSMLELLRARARKNETELVAERAFSLLR
jgi:hypothetical protein